MPMNTAILHMMRNRRQREGKRPAEPTYPMVTDVGEFADALHPAFSWVTTEEHNQRTNYFMPPAFETNALEEYLSSYKPDTELDPIPQSDFYAEANKIRPWAHVRAGTAGYLAIAELEGVDNSDFENGWLNGKGYFPQHVPQYVGYQNPIDISPLIPEPQYTTYGAQNQLATGPSDAYLFD